MRHLSLVLTISLFFIGNLACSSGDDSSSGSSTSDTSNSPDPDTSSGDTQGSADDTDQAGDATAQSDTPLSGDSTASTDSTASEDSTASADGTAPGDASANDGQTAPDAVATQDTQEDASGADSEATPDGSPQADTVSTPDAVAGDDTTTTEPDPQDQCTGTADQIIITNTLEAIYQSLTDCSDADSESSEEAVSTCVAEKTGLTAGCSGCWSAFASCSLSTSCGSLCEDLSQENCQACILATGCFEDMLCCSGVQLHPDTDASECGEGTTEGGGEGGDPPPRRDKM